MSLNITSQKYGGGDLSWLDSRHGVTNARTITLDAAQFADATDGIVKAGTPVEAGDGGLYKPFTSGTLAGFTLNDVSIKDGDETVAMLDHGRINVDKLPVEDFTPPAQSAFIFLNAKEVAA